MFTLWFSLGGEKSAAVIGGTLLNMAVFGAMFSYVMQGLSFILLRRNLPNIPRPYRSPLGIAGRGPDRGHRAGDDLLPALRPGVPPGRGVGRGVVRGRRSLYFAIRGRHKLILSPEEEFAMSHKTG